jgi:hypothetical protein
VRSDEYSVDGQVWTPVPKGIHVLGSRFALAIKSLKEADFALPLARTHVAEGPSRGRIGGCYVSGRVDKACLELDVGVQVPAAPGEKVAAIGLVAELCEPYAVFLRNTPR